jgi:hypothetical protein
MEAWIEMCQYFDEGGEAERVLKNRLIQAMD